MQSVFISYSNKDRAFVERLAGDLDGHGLKVFYDQRIQPGDSWAESLSNAIDAADFILIALSPNSVESQWVIQETTLALSREVDGKARVIPLLIEPCQVPQPLATKTYASFDQDYDAGLRRVLDVLQGRTKEALVARPTSPKAIAQIRSEVKTFKTEPPATTPQLSQSRGSGKLRCFIVMPFGDEMLQEVYEYLVKPVLEGACDLEVERGDDLFGSNVIMDDIKSSIDAADLIVADLTGKNANVFYEVGICHAIDKPVLLLAQSMDDVPFDLRHRRVLLYSSCSPRGCKKFEVNLREQAAAMVSKIRNSAA